MAKTNQKALKVYLTFTSLAGALVFLIRLRELAGLLAHPLVKVCVPDRLIVSTGNAWSHPDLQTRPQKLPGEWYRFQQLYPGRLPEPGNQEN